MAYDKKLHLLAGLGIAIIFGWHNPPIGLLAGFAAGIAKEVYDYLDYGGFDELDMLITWLGATVGIGIVVLLKML